MSSNQKKIDIVNFLNLSSEYPVIDVRSPSEYSAGHIPGAVNIPLFNDREREIVGTTYKNQGRKKAILAGLDLVGPAMTGKLKRALETAERGKVLVYCWRGGMRSEAMAWLFSLGDIETEILSGGYKSFRNHVLETLTIKRRYIILGGLTGSGKTGILKHLHSTGSQVIDLEGIACHKGSAFGAIGQPPQPTSEHFANLLWEKIRDLDPGKPVWLEDESKNIGTIFMPDGFFSVMRESPVIALIMDVNTRMPRLLGEYSTHSKDELIRSVQRLSKRLGGDMTSEAVKSIESDDFRKAIEITLRYYDRTYLYGLKQRSDSQIRYVETDTDDIAINAGKILEAAGDYL